MSSLDELNTRNIYKTHLEISMLDLFCIRECSGLCCRSQVYVDISEMPLFSLQTKYLPRHMDCD